VPLTPVPAAPQALPKLLYLAAGSLVGTVPGAGSLMLPQSGAPITLTVGVDVTRVIDGSPTLVLFHQLKPRHGAGNPRAVVGVALQDCDAAGVCRTFDRKRVLLVRGHRGWTRTTATLDRVHTVIPAGHVLRLVLSLGARSNVTAARIGYGGPSPSRLLLP
jgi:hypothetical protein